jgi:hypothetical protein
MRNLCPCCHSDTDPREELNVLGRCFEAISDLLTPAGDLHAIDRESFALLLWYLNRRHQAAIQALFERPDPAGGRE